MNLVQKLKFYMLEKALKPVLKWAEGKKSVMGGISLALWVVIYAVPAVRPDLAYLSALGLQAQEFLQSAGLPLDTELLASGVTLTVIGLADKVRRYLLKLVNA